MGTSIKIKKHHTIKQLEKALSSSNDEGQKTKIRALILLLKNTTRASVAKTFSVNANTLTGWIKRYNKTGLKALETNKGGRPEGNPKWEASIFTALTKEVDKQSQYWSLLNMTEWIKDTYKKDIPENTLWYRLQKLNYSHKSSRPSPYLGDKAKQEEFKKNRSRKTSASLKTT